MQQCLTDGAVTSGDRLGVGGVGKTCDNNALKRRGGGLREREARSAGGGK